MIFFTDNHILKENKENNRKIPVGIDLQDPIKDPALALHERYRGKLEIRSKVPIKKRSDLSLVYTPGVASVCREIERDPFLAYRYTMKSNTIAIVTDGSAVLGLGDIGGTAAIPVMEGKALLFKRLAGIDAFPICFEGYQTDFVDVVRNIAPVFGGINLEDIAAPKCFLVEEALQDIGIPVMHDDQHGTAITVLAALLNAAKVTGRTIEDMRVVISGAGAAGYAISRMLRGIGYEDEGAVRVNDLIVVDTKGIISRHRNGLYDNKYKFILADETNSTERTGSLADAFEGADAFVGVSSGGIVTSEMVRSMADSPIVFAMANPVPEIMPDIAEKSGAAVAGTGRSDLPNQINNALAFPGVFRGALDACATRISDHMKIAAAYALAGCIKKPHSKRILPNVLDKRVVPAISAAVVKAADESGCARSCKI